MNGSKKVPLNLVTLAVVNTIVDNHESFFVLANQQLKFNFLFKVIRFSDYMPSVTDSV